MAQAHKGDIGTVIKIDVGENISSATVRKIKYKKPATGTIGEWTAAASGTTAIAYTTTAAADLNEIGTWQLQGYIEMPAWKGHTTKPLMEVLEVLTVAAP